MVQEKGKMYCGEKMFSVLVFELPKRQNKTNSVENHYDSTKENLSFQR